MQQTVTLYTRPGCVQCNATKREFNKNNIQFQTVDLSEDTQAEDKLKTMGYRQLPVVIVGDDHWTGFRPDKIAQLTKGDNANDITN